MPATAPRNNTTKKENQLRQKQQELEHAICNRLPPVKLAKAAERLRAAQLSLLKARLHWIAECGVRRSGTFLVPTREYGRKEDVEKAIRLWTNKPVETILQEHRKT